MLRPMISLLLTPPVLPFKTFTIPGLVGEEVGTKDTGLPLVELMAFIFDPNAMVLTAVFLAAVRNVAFEPEGTTDTRVFVTVFLDVDCKETGQFRSPVERHRIAVFVKVTLVLVVVDDTEFGAGLRADIVARVAAALTFPVVEQAAARVVKKSGTWVLGVGPHVWSSIASVAPALAPRSMVYSSTTCTSHLGPLPAGAAVTLVINCATSANTAATTPALKSRGMPAIVSLGVLISRPALMPMRRSAVRTAPGVWIVTGRNSKLPPLLKRLLVIGKRIGKKYTALREVWSLQSDT
jgi:hypothetical protein